MPAAPLLHDETPHVRILIADDHGVLRAGLRILLEEQPGLEVVGEAADGGETLRQAEALRPDLVLLDISLPDMDGIQVATTLKQLLPDVMILVLTAHEDSRLLYDAVRAGASGYVVKRAAESDLILAIAAVLRGDLYVHPVVTRALTTMSATSQPPSPESHLDALTPRELDVLKLLAQGHTNRQIAEALQLSMRTVESHRANLTDKLGFHNRAELTRYAAQHGLIHRK